MPDTLSDFNAAARLREIIRMYATEVVDEMYPRPRYATVTAVQEATRTATVQYPDEVATFTIPYSGIIPAVGSIVRVVGRQGAKYIEAVVSRAQVVPAGLVADYVGTASPAGWQILDGTTIVNAQTLRPDLWAVAPAAWRSGANIILPDARGRVTVAYTGSGLFATIGAVGGNANATGMPDHQHYNGDHTHTGPDHTHYRQHSHSGTTNDPNNNHVHIGAAGTNEYVMRDGAYYTGYGVPFTGSGLAVTWIGQTNTINQWHTHTFSTGGTSDYTSYMNATHGGGLNCAYQNATHGGSIATSTVIGGTAPTNANYQPYIAFTKMIKL